MHYSLQKLLPVRFKPFPDELFTSWLVRLARENGTKLQTFSSLLFSERRIWSRDLDKSADGRHLAVMSEKTGLTTKEIGETLLRSFEGRFYETHNPNGNSSWLLPVGVFHQTRLNCGLQICPACLRDDGKNPYYRKYWRVSWVTVCEKHKTVLIDRCPNCRAPIVFYRGEMGYRNLYSNFSNTQCPSCNLYWAEKETIDKTVSAHPSVIDFQKRLKEAVITSWIKLNEHGEIFTIAFFNGLKHILKLLSVSKRSRCFREIACIRSELPIKQGAEDFHSFDHLPVETRYETLQLASWLLSDWPNRFVKTAKLSRTWSATLLPYNTLAPFWYWLPIHDFLSRRTHYTTETEIFAALDYLKNHFDLLMPSHLEKFIGKPYLFEKRSGLFIASIYERLKKHNESRERDRSIKVEEESRFVGTGRSKTAAKKLRRIFKKENSCKVSSFRRSQTMLNRLIITHRRNGRLKMVREMERVNNAVIVGKRFGVTPPVVLKWYRRFQESGIEGLNDHARCPRNFPRQIIKEQERQWIREIHSEGLELPEIKEELERRHSFSISEGGLYRALKRLGLVLPNSKKLKNKDRIARIILSKIPYRPHKKIFTEQEGWILELHGNGLNNSQIRKKLQQMYNLTVGVNAVRDVLVKHGLFSCRSKMRKGN